jgi:hypothetical protein
LVKDKLLLVNNPHHFVISAKTGEGVSEMFFKIIELINNAILNIKIIDQIEEKEEKQEDDEGTTKIVIKDNPASSIKLSETVAK